MRHAPAALCLCLLAGLAAPAAAETVVEAIETALTRFPDYRSVIASRRAAQEQVEQARGALYPSLDLALGSGREQSDNATTRPFGRDVTLSRRESELTLTQLLFDWGATQGEVNRLAERAAGAGHQVVNAAEAVALRVGQAYLEVMRLRGQLALAEQNVAAHERTARQVGLLVERGAGRRSDLQQAEGRLALANNLLAQVRGQLAQGESNYQHLVGRSPGALLEPDRLTARLPVDLEHGLREALAAHPGVRAAERELNAALADRNAARGRMAPRLNLEAGVARNRDIDGLAGPNEERFLMLRLRFNLFRGGTDFARLREAEARIDEANANLARTRNDVERDLRRAWHGLAANRERIGELQRHAEVSAQVVEAYRAQFGIGQRTLLDVLNAESELYNARGSALDGLLGVTAGEMLVLASMGTLTRSLGVAVAGTQHASDATR